MMDLTQEHPRSAGETMLGIVQLARTIDKAKASASGRLGEYKYDCPMDQGLFAFLAMNPKKLLDVVKKAKSDIEIESYLKPFLAKKASSAVEAFNKRWLSEAPTGESLRHFNELRSKIAPNRLDITTWVDILDLEEGRHVAQREVVRA